MTRQFGYHSDSATYPHEPSIHMIRGVGRGTGSAATMWIIVDAGSRNEDAASRPNCVPLSLVVLGWPGPAVIRLRASLRQQCLLVSIRKLDQGQPDL